MCRYTIYYVTLYKHKCVHKCTRHIVCHTPCKKKNSHTCTPAWCAVFIQTAKKQTLIPTLAHIHVQYCTYPYSMYSTSMLAFHFGSRPCLLVREQSTICSQTTISWQSPTYRHARMQIIIIEHVLIS